MLTRNSVSLMFLKQLLAIPFNSVCLMFPKQLVFLVKNTCLDERQKKAKYTSAVCRFSLPK